MKNTLFIFPCCADKVSGGNDWAPETLAKYVDQKAITHVRNTRKLLLDAILQDSKYLLGKYNKNISIHYGPEFGCYDNQGKYLPAIQRYCGSLYKAISRIDNHLQDGSLPNMLILSALYGPLHPLDMIQDYNLKISDPPAYRIWKEYFPPFLMQYVDLNRITEIKLYLGRTTHYLKVTKQAVIPLIKEGKVNRVTQYEVVGGNSYHTPYNHGLLIAHHLGLSTSLNFSRNVEEIELV